MTQTEINGAKQATCARCPQTFMQWTGDRKQILCRDCRAVMNARERAIWAGRHG